MRFRPVQGTVNATQWASPGDHESVGRLVSADYGGDAMHECGSPIALHGKLEHSGEVVCPGDWVVVDHGSVKIWKDAAFREAFEPSPTWETTK